MLSLMILRSRLRHPMMVIIGLALLSLFSATEALGMRACLHQGALSGADGGHHGAGPMGSEHGDHDPTGDHHAGDHHASDRQHAAHSALGEDHSGAFIAPGCEIQSAVPLAHSKNNCDCGSFSGGGVPVAPVAQVEAEPEPRAEPVLRSPSVDPDDIRPTACRIPHLLPPPLAPPAHS